MVRPKRQRPPGPENRPDTQPPEHHGPAAGNPGPAGRAGDFRTHHPQGLHARLPVLSRHKRSGTGRRTIRPPAGTMVLRQYTGERKPDRLDTTEKAPLDRALETARTARGDSSTARRRLCGNPGRAGLVRTHGMAARPGLLG